MKVEYAPSFKKSWDKLFAWYYAPLRWWKAFLYFPQDIKHWWQRMSRGWADSDTWSLDFHFLKIMPEMLRHLSKHANGHPGQLNSMEEWQAILNRMARGFEDRWKWEMDYMEMMGFDPDDSPDFKDPGFKQLYEYKDKHINDAFNESMDLFKEYFFNLWD